MLSEKNALSLGALQGAQKSSQKTEMVDLSIKLWNALTSPYSFSQYQAVALSLFR